MAGESDVPPTVRAQLAHAERILATAGSPAPQDEALALLSSLLRMPTALLVRSDSRMSPADVAAYAARTARRAAGEAIPHITGHLGFMGLDLTVGRNDPLDPAGVPALGGGTPRLPSPPPSRQPAGCWDRHGMRRHRAGSGRIRATLRPYLRRGPLHNGAGDSRGQRRAL